MAKKLKFPVTPALRFLRSQKVAYQGHLYDYEEKGGTQRSSLLLDVDEHCVIKTLVMEAEAPLIVLMHGDKQVSTGALARLLDVKQVRPMAAKEAQKWSGYQFGGTSPFGMKRSSCAPRSLGGSLPTGRDVPFVSG